MHNDQDIRKVMAELQARGIGCLAGEPMAAHTTYRLGGPAALMVTPETVAALCETLDTLALHGVPLIVAGGGSNLLISDEGFDGAVVRLGEGFRTLEVDGRRMRVGAGLSLSKAVLAARDHGLEGLECATGIPGTVGGAIAMNAGSRDEWIGSAVRAVTYVPLPTVDDPTSATAPVTLGGDSVHWGYRSTDLRDHVVVTEAILELAFGDASVISDRMADATLRRRTSQPLNYPNAGSVFKNPPGDSAGRLIEACGLKGFTLGGAEVSMVHANFIVAHPGAQASDVHRLVQHIQREVVENVGVELAPEIRFIGRF